MNSTKSPTRSTRIGPPVRLQAHPGQPSTSVTGTRPLALTALNFSSYIAQLYWPGDTLFGSSSLQLRYTRTAPAPDAFTISRVAGEKSLMRSTAKRGIEARVAGTAVGVAAGPAFLYRQS